MNKKLADGQKIPKWDPPADVEVYVRKSLYHAGNVSLVLDPKSGLISPQYHVIFYDTFITVTFIRSGHEPPNWNYLATSCTTCIDSSDLEPALDIFDDIETTSNPDVRLYGFGVPVTEKRTPESNDASPLGENNPRFLKINPRILDNTLLLGEIISTSFF